MNIDIGTKLLNPYGVEGTVIDAMEVDGGPLHWTEYFIQFPGFGIWASAKMINRNYTEVV